MTAWGQGTERRNGDQSRDSRPILGRSLQITVGVFKGLKGEFVKRSREGVILRIGRGVYVAVSERAVMP